MLQLHLVIIQQPLKKSMRGNGKSPLMKDGKGHDVPFERRRLTLIAGQQPLPDGGQRAKEATADEALQTPWGDARSAPQLHQGNWGERWARA